ncbi:MAG: M23 family metallopeptidase [Gammaproteobacteria bacterium]|nr:M23 family metallopeptidase [Gammaproteobacteria bacterium]MYD76258.1 M23 family metallopeptidase [Gammaproteobacteria bacterium]MYJ52317.1 M23 family metallopeptidase [Gammaproteobacteria bacterium]
MHRPARFIPFLLLVAALMLSVSPGRSDLPRHQGFPGGVSLVPLGQHEHKPNAFFGLEPVLVIRDEDEWLAVVGLPMDIAPGKYLLRVAPDDDGAGRHGTHAFTVHPLHPRYRQRAIRLPRELAPRQLAGPDNREIVAIDERPMSEHTGPVADFQFVHVIASGSFVPYGRIVTRTDDVDAFLQDHPWLTYLTSPGETARAPGRGVVERGLSPDAPGQGVIIRHAEHFRSILTFMGDSPVAAGDTIETGQPIGTASLDESIGSGRIDWHLLLNGVPVDPLLFVNGSSAAP